MMINGRYRVFPPIAIVIYIQFAQIFEERVFEVVSTLCVRFALDDSQKVTRIEMLSHVVNEFPMLLSKFGGKL